MFLLTTKKKTSGIILNVSDTVKISLSQNELIEVEIQYSIHQKTNSVIKCSHVLYFKIMGIEGKKEGENADITIYDFLVSFIEKVFDQRLLERLSEVMKIDALKIQNATATAHPNYTVFLPLKAVYGDFTKFTNLDLCFVFDMYVQDHTQKTCLFFRGNEFISQLDKEKPKKLAQTGISVKRLLVEEIKCNGVIQRYCFPF